MVDTAPLDTAITKRYVCKEAEELLNQKQPIEGHPSGYVELVDYMGGDPTIIRAATATRGTNIFRPRVSPKDITRFLVANKALKPFRFAQYKFAVQAPISDALKFVYLSDANVNEYSGRYSIMLDTALIPGPEEIRRVMTLAGRAKGREEDIAREIRDLRDGNFGRYKEMIDLGFARELSREGLGTNNDTRFYLKLSIDALASAIRSGPDDSPSTRAYKSAIAKIARMVAPLAWEALMEEYQGRAVKGNLPEDIRLNPISDDEIIDPKNNSGLSPASWKPSPTKRVVVPALENLLFVPVKVLDKGEIQPVDYMGNDSALAQAARTSYGQGTRTLQEDEGLIRSLVRDRHNTPLEMGELAIEVKAPVLVEPRQFGRHRTVDNTGLLGVTPLGSSFYLPPKEEMKYQDKVNRQGRGNLMDQEEAAKCRRLLEESFVATLDTVNRLRVFGVPEELVRQQKGVGFYTIGSMTSDLHNWAGFVGLRADPHAQKEAQPYAHSVRDFLEAQFPIGCKALEDYRFKALTFSLPEQKAIGSLPLLDPTVELTPELFRDTPFSQLIDKRDPSKGLKFSREGEGFVAKIQRFRGLGKEFPTSSQ